MVASTPRVPLECLLAISILKVRRERLRFLEAAHDS